MKSPQDQTQNGAQSNLQSKNLSMRESIHQLLGKAEEQQPQEERKFAGKLPPLQ